MLRDALLGCAFILPTVLGSAFAGQFELDFGAENLVAKAVQIPFNHSDSYRLLCYDISRSISPVSQVLYPGSTYAFLSEPLLIAYVDP